MAACFDEGRPARAEPAQRVVEPRRDADQYSRRRAVEVQSPEARGALEAAILVEDDTFGNQRCPERVPPRLRDGRSASARRKRSAASQSRSQKLCILSEIIHRMRTRSLQKLATNVLQRACGRPTGGSTRIDQRKRRVSSSQAAHCGSMNRLPSESSKLQSIRRR